MLSKNEKLIMAIVFDCCTKSGACLISTAEIRAKLVGNKLSEEKIKSTLRSLELDGYFDLVDCFKGDEHLFCINLRPKGYSFIRDFEQQRRTILNKILLAIVSATITFLVGRLLFYLF